MEGGEEIQKPSDELEVVILGVTPDSGNMAKTFYEAGYQSGSNSPPDCSSVDGIAPDSWVQNPQSSRCGTCPKNIFGSATNNTTGKKAKACKDSKHLWVTLSKSVEGTIFLLSVPVTSLKAVSEYGRYIAQNGFPLAAILTRLTMVDSEFPQLEFSVAGFLPEQTAKIAFDRKEQKEWAAIKIPLALESGEREVKPRLADAPVSRPAEAAAPAKTETPAAATSGGGNPLDGW